RTTCPRPLPGCRDLGFFGWRSSILEPVPSIVGRARPDPSRALRRFLHSCPHEIPWVCRAPMTATRTEPLTSSRVLSAGTRPRRGRVPVVANLKGGVGKTTTAVNLACGLARGIRRPGSTDYEVTPQKTLL